MKKNILLRTNICVCAVIILGFVITSIISYSSNQGIFRKDVENVSNLTSEGIYYQIESIFTRPVNVSLTMANDSLLKDFLLEEQRHLDETSFIQSMRAYLDAYRVKYAFDSVFLVSARTGRYYHFNGLDRVLAPGNPENDWYFAFLKSDEECSLNIDNDEATDNAITIFINCRIKGTDGTTLGVVGVGFRVDYLQALLKGYENQVGVRATLVSRDGTVEVSTDRTGYQAVNLFDTCSFSALKDRILENTDRTLTFWHRSRQGENYIVTRYLPSLDWHLIVEKDTSALSRQLRIQFYGGVLVVVIIVACVLLTITSVIRKYNAQIIQLTIEKEQRHRAVFQEATEQLYENIYEVDVTHDRAASEATACYFESLGAAPDVPYSEALETIARKQIKEEFRQGYIDTFFPANVLKAYRKGVNSLRYELMISMDGGKNYYWIRITARLFAWEDDNSVRMLVYRQNIDAEKRHECHLFEQMQKDSLTGLYNKVATQERIRELLAACPDSRFAFFILDVDKFKLVNDTLGHGVGDTVLEEFARTLKAQFRDGDVVGRIGGDEFVAFVRVPGSETVEKKARDLVTALRREVTTSAGTCVVTASIGVALVPEAGREFETLYKNADAALYRTKKNGRNGYTICAGTPDPERHGGPFPN